MPCLIQERMSLRSPRMNWTLLKQQAPANIFQINDPPSFQIQVTNDQLEKPMTTATLEFDIGDHTFSENFGVMKNLAGPILGLHFMRHNCVVIDTTHGLIHTTHSLIHFPHLTMQVKSTESETTAKPQVVLIHDSTTVPSMTTRTMGAFVDHSSECNTIGTVTQVGKVTETSRLILSHSISKTIKENIAVKVTNKTESPVSIKKSTQIAEFSVVTPEQSKLMKPADTAILCMIRKVIRI